MFYILLLFSLAILTFSISVDIGFAKTEVKSFLQNILTKFHLKYLEFPNNYKFNAGMIEFQQEEIVLQNYSINKDNIGIDLISNKNEIKINGRFDFLQIQIIGKYKHLFGSFSDSTIELEIIGVEFSICSMIKNNQIYLQIQENDKIIIDKIQIKSDLGKIMNTLFNFSIDNFLHNQIIMMLKNTFKEKQMVFVIPQLFDEFLTTKSDQVPGIKYKHQSQWRLFRRMISILKKFYR